MKNGGHMSDFEFRRNEGSSGLCRFHSTPFLPIYLVNDGTGWRWNVIIEMISDAQIIFIDQRQLAVDNEEEETIIRCVARQ